MYQRRYHALTTVLHLQETSYLITKCIWLQWKHLHLPVCNAHFEFYYINGNNRDTKYHMSFFTARRYAKRGICRVCLSVCVCVSVTLLHCIKTAKRRITQITPHDSPVTLVFWCQSSRRNSNEITPYGGNKCRWGGLKFVTFDEKRAITRKRYKIDA